MASTNDGSFGWSFCDNDSFAALLGDQLGSTDPPCNAEIVVLPLSHVLLVLISISRLYRLRLASSSTVAANTCRFARTMHSGRMFLTLVLLIIPLIYVADAMPAFERFTVLLQSGAWLLVFIILVIEFQKSICSPPSEVYFSIFIVFVASTVKMVYVAMEWTDKTRTNSEVTNLALFIVHFICSALLAFSVAFPSLYKRHNPEIDQQKDVEAPPEHAADESYVVPEQAAGLYSRMFFNWMTPLMTLGKQRALLEADVWNLNKRDRAQHLYSERFLCAWQVELQKPAEQRSLPSAFFRCYKKDIYVSAFFKLINDLMQFAPPLLLSRVIQFMEKDSSETDAREGLLYALLFFSAGMMSAIAEGVYFQVMMRMGMQIRSIIVSSIFGKTLKMTSASLSHSSSGKINNMVSSDAEATQQFVNNLHQIWSAPLRIVLAIGLLFVQLSWGGVIGSLLFFVVIPLQGLMMKKVGVFIKQALKSTDERVKIVGEVFSSMSVVKCYAWEDSFLAKVSAIRKVELRWMLKSAILLSLNMGIVFILPMSVALLSFSSYTQILDKVLTPEKAFTSLALFGMLGFPLFQLPQILVGLVTTKIAMKRIQTHLESEENEKGEIVPFDSTLPVIDMKESSFSWVADEGEDGWKPTLRHAKLEVNPGELVVVVGGTGQGKSTLAAAILGDVAQVEGDPVILRGRFAYVPQQSWIFNASVRDNILFGEEYDEVRFKKAVKAASMRSDLALLPNGVETEIGEKGVNLSGGQKQRVSIARAVYANADVYIFDDPLSALDAHVGRAVFEDCICGVLRDKARVLITNQVHFVGSADKIVMIDDGGIIATGTYKSLMSDCEQFRSLVEEQAEETEEQNNEIEIADLEEVASRKSSNASEVLVNDHNSSKLVQAEERALGRVSMDVLKYYYAALGGAFPVIVVLGLFALTETITVGSNIWLQEWTSDPNRPSSETQFYLGIYALWVFGNGLFTVSYRVLATKMSITAGERLHSKMFRRMIRAPMLFFERTPHGRIINRFSKDTSDIDRQLMLMTTFFVLNVFTMISIIVVIGATLAIMLAVFFPDCSVIIVYVLCWQYFQSTSRELKRLDSISRSPVYAHFSQSFNGLSTIRAFRREQSIIRGNYEKLDANVKIILASFSANRWLGSRLEFLGSTVVLSSTLMLVVMRDNFSAAQSGLILTYSLATTGLFTRMVRSGSMAENSFNSVERIMYYSKVETEEGEEGETHFKKPPETWPKDGHVELKNVILKYRDDLDPVLHDLSVDFPARAKIGIVGRTGAGKSSLFVALFRLRELSQGSILIDDVDISKISLNDLRSRLAIIPQDPVLFSGTVRFNLDPFDEHSDEEVWSALERSFLKDVVASESLKLDYIVSEGGSNFSVGQRQLLCLARALLRSASVLVLDEATAAVDVQTDKQIQRMIRENFSDCTMLIIAHRLQTIIDADRILVLGTGRVLEYDTPAALVQNPLGEFTSMLNDMGSGSAEFLKKVARGEEQADFDTL